MRITLLTALLALSACGTSKRVAFINPRGGVSEAPAQSNSTIKAETTPTVATNDEEDLRLRAAVAEYRLLAEEVMTLVWAKPIPSAAEAATHVVHLDKVLKINEKLQRHQGLGAADQTMLVEGAEVMLNERQKLTKLATAQD